VMNAAARLFTRRRGLITSLRIFEVQRSNGISANTI